MNVNDKSTLNTDLCLVFACSGAADVGEIADLASRKLGRDGVAKMFCLAGIGGRVGEMIEKTEQASKILAIDGCETACAKNTLEQAGFTDIEHTIVTDLGMEKGGTPLTAENVAKVVGKATEKLV